MIRVFGQTDRDFSTNGDVVLRPLKAKIHKEDNGPFYLDLETGLDYVDYLAEGNIVVANTPQGYQPFRIRNPQKSKSKVTVRAKHVFFDAENYLIADSYVVNKNCNDALAHLNSATEPTSQFETYSDVNTVTSFRCVRKSLYEAIQTVVERWGGHLVRDGFMVRVLQSIGQDNGVTVRYRKNLREITCAENWDDVVTKLLPVGKNGILLNAVDPSASIYVSADLQYPIPYAKSVSFEQEHISEDDYRDPEGVLDEDAYKRALVADLRAQAEGYVATNKLPRVNYTLRANIDTVTDIGDIIAVEDSRLGVSLITNVIAYDYDCLLKKYTEIEFGNFRPTLSGLFGDVTAIAGTTANAAADSVRQSVDNDLRVINGRVQTLDDNQTAMSADISGLQTDVSTAQGEISGLQTDVSTAQGDIAGLQTDVGTAQGEISGLQTDVSTAQGEISDLQAATQMQRNETYTVVNALFAGFLNDNASEFTFSVGVPKAIGSLSCQVTALLANANNVDGAYTFGSYVAGGYDVVADSTITVTATVSASALVTIRLAKAGGFAGTANTPQAISVNRLVLRFT